MRRIKGGWVGCQSSPSEKKNIIENEEYIDIHITRRIRIYFYLY